MHLGRDNLNYFISISSAWSEASLQLSRPALSLQIRAAAEPKTTRHSKFPQISQNLHDLVDELQLGAGVHHL